MWPPRAKVWRELSLYHVPELLWKVLPVQRRLYVYMLDLLMVEFIKFEWKYETLYSENKSQWKARIANFLILFASYGNIHVLVKPTITIKIKHLQNEPLTCKTQFSYTCSTCTSLWYLYISELGLKLLQNNIFMISEKTCVAITIKHNYYDKVLSDRELQHMMFLDMGLIVSDYTLTIWCCTYMYL